MSIIKFFFYKIKNIILSIFGKIYINLLKNEITDEYFFKKIWDHNYKVKNLDELNKYFINRKKPTFFINLSLKNDIVYRNSVSNIQDKIIFEANRICNHVFNILGSGDVNLGKSIDWHCDFKTSYKWNPKKYYKGIEIPYGKADIKIPWELSRFQHLFILGEAYWLTNDEGYTKEFVNQITDWIDKNKPGFGVNWHCTMDVAIRSCNWILGYYYFKKSSEITSEFLFKYLKSLYQHGKHIAKNLEYSKNLTTNHYLADITGLIYLGVMFPEFKESGNWVKLGIEELIKEMEKQVYPDGCSFEASTCYHRLALELLFFSTLIVVINDDDFERVNFEKITRKIFGDKYTEKLYKMFDVVAYLLKPNGKMPQIGDNDSGRFFNLFPRKIQDMRYLLALGAVFFKEQKWKIKEFFDTDEDIAESLIIYGKKGREIWDSLEWNFLKNIESKAFSDVGWYVMRNDKNYCVISCGPNGQNGYGGHCHCDKLSFVLCKEGRDVIVDSGTYVYTSNPEWRNKFRSTAYHNTIKIDGKEQNRFNKKRLFQMDNNVVPKCLKWETDSKVDIFIGEHYGYDYSRQPVVHQRKIQFYKKEGKLKIIDRLKGTGNHYLEWNFILSPDFKQQLKINSDKLQLKRDSGFYSPEYGIVAKTEKVSAILNTVVPVEIEFCIDR